MHEPLLRRYPPALLAPWLEAELRPGRTEPSFSGVCTDTRKLQAGELFFALRGENFDGHHFVDQACALGARGLVVERGRAPRDAAVHVFEVDDVKRSLGLLAAAIIRERRALGDFELFAVTGSNGKTTTKELLAAVLGLRGACLKTSGNLNNDIGMPLVALRLSAEHRTAVLEMGANAPGEIAGMVALAEPDVALLTAVAPAHLLGFGSIAGVAKAKAEIFGGQRCRRIVIPEALLQHYPELAADPRTVLLQRTAEAHGPAQSIGLLEAHSGKRSTQALYRLGEQQVELTIPLIGVHNAQNFGLALGALYGAWPALEGMRQALAALKLPSGRLELLSTPEGVELLNDAYNANPSSMRAALSTLCEQAPAEARVVVLGEMRELGPQAELMHRELGAAVAAAGVRAFLTVGGELAVAMAQGALDAGMAPSKVTTWTAEPIGEILSALRSMLRPGDVLLLKASRAMALERVVAGLGARARAPEPGMAE